MKIYIASSWKNKYQPEVVKELQNEGHIVYDFRYPATGDSGFSWNEIDPNWQNWKLHSFLQALEHPAAVRGYNYDQEALDWAEVIIMVTPCGDSSHLELGYGRGAKKYTAIYMPEGVHPELMYKMADYLAVNLGHIIRWLERLPK